jgi:hypothetical protein
MLHLIQHHSNRSTSCQRKAEGCFYIHAQENPSGEMDDTRGYSAQQHRRGYPVATFRHSCNPPREHTVC